LAKAPDPEAEYRAAIAKLDQRLRNIRFQHEHGGVSNTEYMERTSKVNVEKQALRARLDAERKAFRPEEGGERFAAIVAATVAGRFNVDATQVMPQARPRASGQGRHALGLTVASHPHVGDGIHHREEADEIEFSLWAQRLPDLLEHIEVDVVDKRAAVVLVPRKEWVPYLRKKLPGVDSMSFLRSKASSRVSNVWKWPRP
jgi:hypothetical protein